MVQDARGSAAGVHGYSSCNSFRAIHDIFGDVSRNPRDPTDKVGKSWCDDLQFLGTGLAHEPVHDKKAYDGPWSPEYTSDNLESDFDAAYTARLQ